MFSLASFAVLALLLAAIGVYGVISYAVLQRTREIGIRIALGATGAKVLQLLVGQQLTLITVGGGLGLALAFALSRTLQSLLFGVGARDLMTFVQSWAVLTVVAVLASAAPAWRATRCDPNLALRYE
jgi:ABC-type antimicrobial peptide transport system permease subunit